MPGFSSRGIFLSYRREDAAPYALLLRFQLRERFPDTQVFMDMDSIEIGKDFREVINEAVHSSAVLVALVGRQWTALADGEGHRRLDDPDDLVRFEIQTALERDVLVIPVLVDGARPLRLEQLPAGLQKLARLNALELSYGRYNYDADRLFDVIQRVLAEVRDLEEADRKAQEEADRQAEVKVLEDQADSVMAAVDVAGPRNDLARAALLFTEAGRIARSVTNESLRASALSSIAQALVATDPRAAARLFAEAESIASSITDESSKASALSSIAQALASTDPARAVHIASSITDNSAALSGIARTLVTADPGRAVRIASSITDDSWKDSALSSVAQALAATDPDRAVRIASSITEDYRKELALSSVAQALAATDPARAVTHRQLHHR